MFQRDGTKNSSGIMVKYVAKVVYVNPLRLIRLYRTGFGPVRVTYLIVILSFGQRMRLLLRL